MAGQFLLNLFITLLWILLKDEPIQVQTVISGFVVGALIVFMMRRFFGGRFYLHRLISIIKLIIIFISEMTQSSITVIKHVISPKITVKPGIFQYKTRLKGDWEVTTLALLLTLTPGSVVMEVNEEGNVFYVHAMDIERYQGDLERSLGVFERAIMEVTR